MKNDAKEKCEGGACVTSSVLGNRNFFMENIKVLSSAWEMNFSEKTNKNYSNLTSQPEAIGMVISRFPQIKNINAAPWNKWFWPIKPNSTLKRTSFLSQKIWRINQQFVPFQTWSMMTSNRNDEVAAESGRKPKFLSYFHIFTALVAIAIWIISSHISRQNGRNISTAVNGKKGTFVVQFMFVAYHFLRMTKELSCLKDFFSSLIFHRRRHYKRKFKWNRK